MSQIRLTRSETDKILAGVCGGLATYLGIDSTIVRLAFLLLIPASGIGLLLYVVLAISTPKESSLNRPTPAVMQENVEELGNTVASGVSKARRHPQGPTIAATLLILLGFYFLLKNLGWLAWINGTWLWPLALIGLGLFLLFRRRR